MKLMTVDGYIKWFSDQMASRTEPKYFQVEHWSRETVEKICQSGLIGFSQKVQSHNEDVKREFVNNYRYNETMVGSLHIPLNPDYISEALGLPSSGELYHKGLHFKDKGWTFFLDKNRKGSFDGSKGIPREWFNEP